MKSRPPRHPKPLPGSFGAMGEQPVFDGLGLEADEVAEFDRGQTGLAEIADFALAATEVAGQIVRGPKPPG